MRLIWFVMGRFALLVAFPACLLLFQNCSSPSALESSSESDTSGSTSDPNPVLLPPTEPSNLEVTSPSSSQQILNWQDNSNNETGFRIERATSADGPFSTIHTTSGDTTSYAIDGLNPSTYYFYRVYSLNGAGESTGFAQNQDRTPAAPLYPPAAPSGLTATALAYNHVNLTWVDNSSDEEMFQVHRATSPDGPFINIVAKSPNLTTHSDTSGLVGATTYYYKIYAYGSTKFSEPTEVVSVTTLDPPPPNPGPLLASVVSGNQVNLTWTDGSTSEEGFIVEMGQGFLGPVVEIANLPPNTTSHSVTGLTPGTTYVFRVKAYNQNGFTGAATLVPIPQ